MTTKRITAVLAAAAVCAASGVTASAAGKYQLLTEPVSVIDGAIDVHGIYDSDGRANAPLLYSNNGYGITGVFDITQKDLKNWRSSGDFTYTEVNIDNFDGAEYFDNAGYILRSYSNSPLLDLYDGNSVLKYFSFKYDGKGKLESILTSDERIISTFGGWAFQSKATSDTEYVLSFYNNNDGELHQIDIPIKWDGVNYLGYSVRENDKYIGYVCYPADSRLDEEWSEWEMYDVDYVVAGITHDGELDTLYSGNHNYLAVMRSGENFLYFVTQDPPFDGVPHLYSVETGDMMTLDEKAAKADDTSKYIYMNNYEVNGLNDNKIIVRRSTDDGSQYYNLVELDSEPDQYGYTPCTLLSEVDAYSSMTTYDGETYLVQTLDGKWGFLNSEGKLVATYDEAGAFMGNYAPVVKDGKAYLVNRNFRCVSEKIDAESVSTLDNGLYNVTIDGENYFMTYSKNKDNEAANDPQETEQTPDETTDSPSDTDATTSEAQDDQTVSDPTDTDNSADTSADTSADDTSADNKDESKANPDTGAASAGIAIGLTVFAAGAVLLSRKRR